VAPRFGAAILNDHLPERIDIFNLAAPYFGRIFIGFACGKAKALPEAGLAWMNFFPALRGCQRSYSTSRRKRRFRN
jgi:hypothetical protein